MPGMKLPLIIQGGMGVGVSGWKLARAVSTQGHLGVVSGTGVNGTLLRRLQDGDTGGQLRRALESFPARKYAEEILRSYFIPGGRAPGTPYKLSPLPSVQPGPALQRLLAIGAYAEVYLAKEGHDGIVGINFLEKLQLTNLPGLYGAMLAGVDFVLMGAGIPREIPGALDRFAENREATIRVSTVGESGEVFTSFDPARLFPELAAEPRKRPLFLAIVSSSTLATHLARKSNGRIDGFVIEGSTAGGHNAPPRGQLRLTEEGEPIYGQRDEPDLASFRELGLPFWLAGSYGAAEKLQQARALGAAGIQVGTAFAFCEESGLSEGLKRQVIEQWATPGREPSLRVFTDPLASPTDFPFKVVPIPGTLSEKEVYEARPRKCDLGYLRQVVLREDGSVSYRCPSEPVEDFVKKEGDIEHTRGRKCLCNGLMSDLGLAQTQEGEYLEPALVTAGDDLAQLGRYLPDGQSSYRARDVILAIT